VILLKVTSARHLPMFWRVCLINGLVFAAGTLALALTPATVSSRVLVSEAVVLTLGFSAILLANGLLLRGSLAPLDRLIAAMDSADLLRPGQRLPESGSGSVVHLIRSFNAMLARLEAEREASTAMALAAQEAERNRIAQELHDEIGQRLTAVLLGLKRARDLAAPDVAEELGIVQDAARGSLEDVRRVAQRLRPGGLEDLGLLGAIAALTSDLAERSGIAVERGFAPGLPPLSGQDELVIYRIAQECLTNVARHSGARQVEVTLSRQGEAVVLQVCDDGRGMRDAAEGAGIRGMRERARLAGGDLQLGPRLGGGTQVRLTVPRKGGG
jgi:two-component system sensor histidine kinase UhpB